MMVAMDAETRAFYNHHLPFVHQQPRHSHDVAASLLATNASQYAEQQEWETEWNTLGLPSRLSPEVCPGFVVSVHKHVNKLILRLLIRVCIKDLSISKI